MYLDGLLILWKWIKTLISYVFDKITECHTARSRSRLNWFNSNHLSCPNVFPCSHIKTITTSPFGIHRHAFKLRCLGKKPCGRSMSFLLKWRLSLCISDYIFIQHKNQSSLSSGAPPAVYPCWSALCSLHGAKQTQTLHCARGGWQERENEKRPAVF